MRPDLLNWLSDLDGGALEKGTAAELMEIDLMLNAFNVFYEQECESEEAVCQPIRQAIERLNSNLADA